MHSREPHERRQHAMQVAGTVTALVFVVWLTTLPMRLSGPAPLAEGQPNQTDLTASVAQPAASSGEARLEVSTTSVYTP